MEAGGPGNRLTTAPVRVITVPIALGAGRSGVDLGAGALANALRGHLERRFQQPLLERFTGSDDVPVQALTDENRIRTGGAFWVQPIAAASRLVAGYVRESIVRGELALTLGGDHSLSIGTLAGAAQACRRLAVIWIDAHADLNWPEVSPSGHVHGMSLAISLGRGPEELTSVAAGAVVRPDDVYLIGIRNLDRGERAWVREGVINDTSMPSIEEVGMRAAIAPVLERIQASRVDAVHISFDVDVLDPIWLPGTGSTEWGGFTYREAARLMSLLRDADLPVRSLDWVELNPEIDPSGASTRVATALLATALGEDPIRG